MDVLSRRELRWRIAWSTAVALGAVGIGAGFIETHKNSIEGNQGRPIPAATKLALERTAEPRAHAIAQSLVDLTFLDPAEASIEDNADKTSALVTAISFAHGREFITQAKMGLSNDYPDAEKVAWGSIEIIEQGGVVHEVQVESVPDVSGPPVWTINYLEAQPRQQLRLLANSFPTRPYGSLNSLPVQEALQENRNLSEMAHQDLSEALGFDALIVQDTLII
jgi:hypothetical protein